MTSEAFTPGRTHCAFVTFFLDRNPLPGRHLAANQTAFEIFHIHLLYSVFFVTNSLAGHDLRGRPRGDQKVPKG
jgi:hypothetical protein